MPRLKLPVEEKRSQHILATFTLRERRAMDRMQKQDGRTYSNMLRDALHADPAFKRALRATPKTTVD